MATAADVRALYMNYLGRLPGGDAEILQFANYSVDQIRTILANSPEASNRAQVMRQAYRTFLGREATDAEINQKVLETSGQTSQEAVKGIRLSSEASEFNAGLENYLYTYAQNESGMASLRNLADGQTFHDTVTAARYHWLNYGKYENRVIPGVTKIINNPDGSIALADKKWFSNNAYNNYSNAVTAFNNTSGGNYGTMIGNLANALADQVSVQDFAYYGKNALDSFYATNKVSAWDGVSSGAQPPTGGFDASYYLTNTNGGSTASQQWNEAQTRVQLGNLSFPDLDVTARFTKDSYLHWYYTTQGKAAGDRGNAASDPSISSQYQEYLTDADYQLYRDNVLGLSTPEKTTILEGNLETVLGPKELQQQQMFGALTRDSLKQAAVELQKISKQQQEFDFYKNLPGFNEIMTVNETIANSLLGDSGIGGVYGWMGDINKLEERVESDISSATGIPSLNNAVYNWQKWFDEQLTARYAEGATIVDPNDPNVSYQLDAEFANDYINRYLKPRFDTSRSMSEFISYMDVQQGEENIFQTQSALDSLRSIADLRAKAYLDGIKATAPLNFNSDFYWDPTGNFTPDDPKISKYEEQKNTVSADWETAKNSGDSLVPGTAWSWKQWGYYYGLDITNKEQFAKLHYQVKGAASGFDPARDVITLKDAEDYIMSTILPEIADEKLNIGDITFLNFITPAEFADSLLEGISLEENKEEWDKLLESIGLSGSEYGIDEVKEYIIEAFQTGAAREIREAIKYLNEKKITPTQKELGVDYIERPEDAKPAEDSSATNLYKIFQSAGYAGTEDDFYENFMTDVDRSEMELLTQAGKGLEATDMFKNLSSSDPFEALGALSTFMDEEQPKTTTSSTSDSSSSSYFKLFDDSDTESYKTESGQKILDEFTSFFKGL